MSEPANTLSIWLETFVVFFVSAFIAFFVFLYAILYLGLPFIPLLPVINFDQLASAFIYAVLLSLVIAFVFHRWRRRH